MRPAIDIIGIQKCSGCFGCFNACPHDAIEMIISEEGFYIPNVNEDKCINCGICQKVCPVISVAPVDRFSKPIAYSAWSKSDKTRLTSSSGGIFSELADIILEQDGVVYGVVWDERFHPMHARATKNEKETLEKMKGSKYVPSYVGNTYKTVVKDLSEGRKVLFSGTPCQVAALNNFISLKKVDKSNLYTVEIVCHGVPSLIVWESYLERISKKIGKRRITSVKFRDKSAGWSNLTLRIEFDDRRPYVSSWGSDWFCWGFLQNYYLNNLCYDCPFSKIPRQGDVTIGDFWGVPKELYDERGVSIVLVNSEKGKELVEKVLERVILVPIELEIVYETTKINSKIISGKLKKPKQREEIITAARKNGFEAVIEKLMFEKSKKKFRRTISSVIQNPKRVLHVVIGKIIENLKNGMSGKV